MGILVFIIIFAAVIVLVAYAYRAQKKRREGMAALAASQGWTALGNEAGVLSSYLPRYLQGRGDYSSYDMAYRAVIEDVTIVFFQYQYTEQRMEYNAELHTEEQRSVTYTFTIINAVINKNVPNVLLLHHSLLSKLASLGEHSGMQQLQLEGDFNKHFDCYITPNDQVNALSLLAPDVMAQLIDKLPNASVEFSEQSMAISLDTMLLEADKIGPLLNNTVSVVKSIENRE